MTDSPKVQWTGFVVFGICIFYFLFEFFLRTAVGTFERPLISDLHLTLFKFSFLSSTSFMMVYGIMQIPVAFIVDYFGLKKSLLIGSLSCTIATFGFAYSNEFYLAVLFRMLMGFGASFGFICLLISIYDWMPKKYNALFIGISGFIGTMGPLMAAGPLNSLSKASSLSWRTVFSFMGLMGTCLIFLILFFVKNNHVSLEKYIVLQRSEGLRPTLKKMFSRLQPWMIAAFSATAYFSIEYLSENGGASFLVLKGLSSNFSASMISLSWLGFAIGSPLLGLISDIKQRRKSVMVFAGLSCLISLSLIIYSNNKPILSIAFILLGMGASGQSMGFAALAEQFKKSFITVGYGINNALITSMVGLGSPCLSFILDSIKTGAQPNMREYVLVFNILIFMAFISFVISLFFIKESFCKSQVDFTILKIKKADIKLV